MGFLTERACRAQALHLVRSFVLLNSLECMHFLLGKDLPSRDQSCSLELGGHSLGEHGLVRYLFGSKETSIFRIKIHN